MGSRFSFTNFIVIRIQKRFYPQKLSLKGTFLENHKFSAQYKVFFKFNEQLIKIHVVYRKVQCRIEKYKCLSNFDISKNKISVRFYGPLREGKYIKNISVLQSLSWGVITWVIFIWCMIKLIFILVKCNLFFFVNKPCTFYIFIIFSMHNIQFFDTHINVSLL